MSKYDTRITPTKHNVYNGPRSHGRKYLNINVRKHHSRKCHTIQLTRSRHYTKNNALISTRNHMIRKQYAKATVNQALCCCERHEYIFEVSSF